MSDPTIGVMMLGVFIVLIMLGFPIAFTLMALGVGFGYYAYFDAARMDNLLDNRVFNLLVNQTYSVMSNDVLTAVPLFLFMGYIVERANIVARLFSSLQIAARRVPGSMAVAALITCALFATATGIVGAVITLMGLLAYPAMLKARYDTQFASGVICAGGTLGILIPPSIMLIVYAATSSVSIVQLYAGALLPGALLAGLYVVYVIGRAALQPKIAPPPPKETYEGVSRGEVMRMMATSFVPLAILILSVLGAILFGLATPSEAASIGALGGLVLAASYQLHGFFSGADKHVPPWAAWSIGGSRLGFLPCVAFGAFGAFAILILVMFAGMFFGYVQGITEWPPGLWVAVAAVLTLLVATTGQPLIGLLAKAAQDGTVRSLLMRAFQLALAVMIVAQIAGWLFGGGEEAAEAAAQAAEGEEAAEAPYTLGDTLSDVATYAAFVFGLSAILLVMGTLFHWLARNVASNRLENQFLRIAGFAAILGLAVAVAAILVTGAVHPDPEAPMLWHLLDAFTLGFPLVAAVACGTKWDGMRESVYLTVRTSAMVCWLFVGSWTFSSVFSYLGGEQLVEEFVVTHIDGIAIFFQDIFSVSDEALPFLRGLCFLILAQFIIFLLGWPLEWSEIVIIFVPIFLPLLPIFDIDPLFFGILVALNLQTSFLTPPMAMSAYYLKGIAPPHVRLVQIFRGCMPFLMMVFLSMIIVYVFPEIVHWLPELVYG